MDSLYVQDVCDPFEEKGEEQKYRSQAAQDGREIRVSIGSGTDGSGYYLPYRSVVVRLVAMVMIYKRILASTIEMQKGGVRD